MAYGDRDRLTGWKAIGAFIGRDARTAKRWERERGMPVHRTPGGARATVWVAPDELDRWMRGSDASAGLVDGPASRERRNLITLGSAASGIAALGFALPKTIVGRFNFGGRPQAAADLDLFLQAQYEADSRTPIGLDAARSDYRRLLSVGHAPARALAGMAQCYLLGREFAALPERQAYEAARACSTTALAIDPRCAGAVRVQGFVEFWRDGHWVSAIRRLERAAALAPTDPLGPHWLATAHAARGAWAAALNQIEVARRLDPESAALIADQSLVRFVSGDRAGGRAGLERLAQVSPAFSAAHGYLAEIHLLEGRDAEFAREMGIEAELRGDADRLALSRRLSAVLGAEGAVPMRLALAQWAQSSLRAGKLSPFHLARAWAAAGRGEQAMSWLESAAATDRTGLAGLPGDALLQSVLGRSPRFQALGRLI